MAKSILTKEEADKIAVAFTPRKFPLAITAAASDFVALQAQQTESGFQPSFRIDRIVADQTGVAELERLSIEEKVEREALARLKDLQEEAYQQAYQLGLDEGREQAFQEQKAVLEEKVRHLDEVLNAIIDLKTQLVTFNETHIMKLVYYLARRIALDEIAEKPEVILPVLRQAISGAQADETITVYLSPSDLEFVEQTKEKLGKDFESLKKARLEASEEIQSGGCVVETNYGDVDATVEQRLEKLWTNLAEKLPRVKDQAGDGGQAR